MRAAAVESLEAAIGYRFAGREILRRALTHSSHVHEQVPGAAGAPRDNEQLEFLGDAVLGFLASEELVRRFPECPEGTLSRIKAYLVSSSYLFEVAQALEIGRYLQLGRGEEMSGGRTKRTLAADALEALIAALYLDGGIDAARAFVERFILTPAAARLERLRQGPERGVDFKGALQELAQVRKLPHPRYTIVNEQGPEHAKTFTIEVRIGRDSATQAEGPTKKAAAQKAARELYELLLAEPRPAPHSQGS